jgi:hypothetical protein
MALGGEGRAGFKPEGVYDTLWEGAAYAELFFCCEVFRQGTEKVCESMKV